MRKMSSICKPFCVFCKHWYDPASAALKPDMPAAHRWIIDENAVNMCMYHSKTRKALGTCGHFESKL